MKDLLPDVPDLFPAARRVLTTRLREVLGDPARRSQGFLLLGDPGSGRSHLARSVAREVEGVVLVHADRDPEGGVPTARLADAVEAALLGAHSPMDAPPLAAALHALGAGRLPPRDALPQAERRPVARALSGAAADRDPHLEPAPLRALVRKALGGEMEAGETGAFRPEGAEVAYERLACGLRLAAHTGGTLLLVEVDARLASDAARRLVADLVRIHDTLPRTLVVLAVPEDVYALSLAHELPASERRRLEGGATRLPPLTSKEAERLARAALAALGRGEESLSRETVRALAPISPRELVTLARQGG